MGIKIKIPFLKRNGLSEKCWRCRGKKRIWKTGTEYVCPVCDGTGKVDWISNVIREDKKPIFPTIYI